MLASGFDVLGLFIVDFGQPVFTLPKGAKHLIELGMNGLGITVLRTLDEKRHAQRDQRDRAVKVERFPVEDQPEHGVAKHREEGRGSRQPDARGCDQGLQLFHRPATTPRCACSARVPDLTRNADIKINPRVSLR